MPNKTKRTPAPTPDEAGPTAGPTAGPDGTVVLGRGNHRLELQGDMLAMARLGRTVGLGMLQASEAAVVGRVDQVVAAVACLAGVTEDDVYKTLSVLGYPEVAAGLVAAINAAMPAAQEMPDGGESGN